MISKEEIKVCEKRIKIYEERIKVLLEHRKQMVNKITSFKTLVANIDGANAELNRLISVEKEAIALEKCKK